MILRPSVVVSPSVTRHGWLILFVAIHAAIAQGIALYVGRELGGSSFSFMFGFLSLLVPLFVFLLLIWRTAYIAVYVRPNNPIQYLVADLKGLITDPHRVVSGALAFVAVGIFFPNFSFLKDVMPSLNPFSWDQTFAEWDRYLHFGHDPYRVLLPILGAPFTITALNAIYHFWLFLMFFVLFVACFTTKNPPARMTFLVAFVLTWAIGGNLVATVLSSAGPVYYARLGLGDTFQPLMDHLQASARISPVWALNVQETLWEGHMTGSTVKGISAMPSMHIASSTLLALYARRYALWAGVIVGVFLALVMLGSVVLGWHYAVDGYLGLIIAVCMWKLAGYLSGPR